MAKKKGQSKDGAKPQGLNKAQQEFLLAQENAELMKTFIKLEEDVLKAEWERLEAKRNQLLIQEQVNIMIEEAAIRKRKCASVTSELKVQQQHINETALITQEILNKKLAEAQAQMFQSQQEIKQLALRKDAEITEKEQAIKDLRQQCDTLAEEFMRLLNEISSKIEMELGCSSIDTTALMKGFCDKIKREKEIYSGQIKEIFEESVQQDSISISAKTSYVKPPTPVLKMKI